jgi:hypothetical protein
LLVVVVKVTVMVQGGPALTEVTAAVDPTPTGVAATKPGEPAPDEVCGAVQPAGTTTVQVELAPKVCATLRKLKVKLLPVLEVSALPGETSMVPSAFASVNVAEAVS